MSTRLNDQVPGVAFGFTQPIEMRVDELVAGVKADVAVLLYGDDLEVLGQKGKEIERVLRTIPGAVDVKADYQANIPTLTIAARAATNWPVTESMPSRYGYRVVDRRTIAVGQIYEGRARFPLIVRLPEALATEARLLQQCSSRSRSSDNRSRWETSRTSVWRKRPPASNTKPTGAGRSFRSTSAVAMSPALCKRPKRRSGTRSNCPPATRCSGAAISRTCNPPACDCR